MARGRVWGLVGVILSWAALTGCLLNTPERVISRFIGHLKGMRWDAMAELVDWPQSSEFVPGMPRSNEGEEEAKKEVMMRIAENLTGFPVRRKTPEYIRHDFLFLKLDHVEETKKGGDWVWLKVRVAMDGRARTAEVLVMKINRVWRIVLTDSIFE